jgi:integrase
MAYVFRKTRVRYVDANGKRCPKGTPGARKRKERSPIYYGSYRDPSTGQVVPPVPLYTDKEASKRELGELVKKAERREVGLSSPYEREVKRPLAEHLADYEAKLQSGQRSAGHVRRTMAFINDVCEAAEFRKLTDFNAEAVNRYAAGLREKGRAARTIQARLVAVKGFTRWAAQQGKLPADPLASVQRPSVQADRRLRRRMLLPDEWAWLRTVTLADGETRHGLPPLERVTLYATAIQTGLRSGELRTLTRGKLHLDASPPFIVCPAGSTKNRKDARQYIQADLAESLRRHVATKAPQAPVFAMPRDTEVATMLRADLAAARKAWLKAAQNASERIEREQSDFLAEANHERERLDFHGLRHTCGAWLAKSGAHPKAVQAVLRHSTITLTMDTYGHLFPGQEAETVARLPMMLGDAEPIALRATGTDDFAAAADDGHADRQVLGAAMGAARDAISMHPMAPDGRAEDAESVTADDAEMPEIEAFPPENETGRGGSRTRTSLTGQGILRAQRQLRKGLTTKSLRKASLAVALWVPPIAQKVAQTAGR